MRWTHIAMLRLRSLFRRRRVEHELDAELRFHLEQQIAANLAAGMNADDARCAALRSFGGVAQLKEECRDARRLGWLEDFLRDLRFSLRSLSRAPGFTAVAVITLALGIGANSAIFSAVYQVLLRPLPFPHADRLVLVNEFKTGVPKTGSPLGRYYDRANSHIFEETVGYWDVSGSNGIVFGDNGSAQHLGFSIVDHGFFSVLGIHPQIGRTFTAADEVPHGPAVFLASDALWRSLLGADPKAIGKVYRLDGLDYTLVGVLPADFHLPGNCDLWLSVAG